MNSKNSVKYRILHIEDDEANRYAVRRILEREGYEVIEAETGDIGMEILSVQTIDLIVLDIRLPDVNGFDLCRKIKADDRFSSIPVLQTSATFVASEDKIEGLESGADGYLAQPIEAGVLVATVRSLLRIRNAERGAQQATQARDDLLAVVSHDLRNPISAISLHINLLQRSLSTEHPKESMILDKLDRVGMAVRRMNRLIEDLLDFSSIEAGKFKVDISSNLASTVLTDACNMMEEVIREKGIQFNVEIPANSTIRINVDRHRMFQVFSNLLGNAIKFTSSGGKITAGMKDLGNFIEFFVRDTGNGISEIELPHVFDRYWQGRDRNQGVGLGLSIVRGIIEAHGGKIRVESKLAQGTSFFFTIPVCDSGVS